ncbi:glyoxylate/hydroxypyruvate reductase A [Undibacterium cyanobacteriorum]|uniref:Glyoxylate/hydroxypyruvate reductase A n=1 Tax=Undibacterium cyanobacteriorum TaxID=3073561 RepID=A0ABY9RGN6_9BURK|nr:glyoxylate/hydroxypyruvate reductase A [Undibacterium sp. 20NA77.5]WMW80391.1 glyoxylate/hydroxypyruvate reductase A [Undibacterium sp. 20NA77.5]
MNIIYYASGADPEVWLKAFRAYLPDAQIRIWEDGDDAPADYALVWKPPAAMLRGRTDLKAIFNLGAGVDAILQLGDALPAGVPLIRVDDAGMGVQMAEYVSHAVLRHFRRFDEYEMLQNQQQWRPLPQHRKEDFSIGVLGLGALGNRILDGLKVFDFPLLGWSRSPKQIDGVQCFHGDAGLDSFLQQTKVLVLILPLTTETENLLDESKLSQLKQGAYVINVARGAHIVDADLLKLIQNGHIAGATLDVFREEPLPLAHPFWSEKRIHITPHISALTVRDESAKQIAGKIAALERGETVAGLVDQLKGY